MKSAAEHREDRIVNRMGRCAHFTGVQNETCKAGVRYSDVRSDHRIPCLKWDANGAECASAQWPTREEAEAYVAKSEAGIERIGTCLKAIKAKHGKARGIQDSMPCPNNCGGTLHYSIAGVNGHVWGTCSTEGCAQWMQ